MPEKIGYGGSVAVLGGPSVAFQRQIEAEGYDKFNVKVPDTETAVLNVGADASTIFLLVITASQYGDTLKFKVDAGSQQLLEEPVFVAGVAAVKAFGKFEKMEIENKLGADVEVEVFLARDPTP